MDIDIDIEYTVIFLYVMLTLMTKSEFRNARAVAEKTRMKGLLNFKRHFTEHWTLNTEFIETHWQQNAELMNKVHRNKQKNCSRLDTIQDCDGRPDIRQTNGHRLDTFRRRVQYSYC